jgi:hypothetical protein
MSEGVDPLAERCADCPAVYAAEPAPVLGPYIGVVGAVLCSLVGAFLLLAPYAFDYRDGAGTMPHSSVVDLATGAGVLVLGLATAALFGGALARRLRVPEPEPGYLEEPLPAESTESDYSSESPGSAVPGYPRAGVDAAAPATAAVPGQPGPQSAAEARPLAPAASLADPGGALRDLLTPLVAALAADLRARETGETEGK